MIQSILIDLYDILNTQYQKKIAELKNNDSVNALFKIKAAMAQLCEETQIKYPNTTKYARKLLLPFPSLYLPECGFSAVNDLLLKKKKEITQRGDLRLKLTKLELDLTKFKLIKSKNLSTYNLIKLNLKQFAKKL